MLTGHVTRYVIFLSIFVSHISFHFTIFCFTFIFISFIKRTKIMDKAGRILVRRPHDDSILSDSFHMAPII